jgi:hypothetical protein
MIIVLDYSIFSFLKQLACVYHESVYNNQQSYQHFINKLTVYLYKKVVILNLRIKFYG